MVTYHPIFFGLQSISRLPLTPSQSLLYLINSGDLDIFPCLRYGNRRRDAQGNTFYNYRFRPKSEKIMLKETFQIGEPMRMAPKAFAPFRRRRSQTCLRFAALPVPVFTCGKA